VRSFFFREEGMVAVEFAVLLPMLVIGFLFLGVTAVRAQRQLDVEQIVRAGVEPAIRDPGQQEVQARLNAAAMEKGYTLWTGPVGPAPQVAPDQLFLSAVRNCACPGVEMERDCRTICPNGRPTIVRYLLRATYGASVFDERLGRMLARMNLNLGFPVLMVQRQVIVR
jgi:hypothetical protein